MPPITSRTRVAESDGRLELSTEIVTGDPRFVDRVWIKLPAGIGRDQLDESRLGDVSAAIALLPAMLTGRAASVAEPVSPALLAGLETWQDVFASWYPAELGRVAIQADARATDAGETRAGTRTASFFTGGVDSFFTVASHGDSIDTLVNVRGFDVPLHDAATLARVDERLDAIEREVGIPIVRFDTNVRELLDQADWGLISHGIGLGYLTLVLGALGYGRVLIPSTKPYTDLDPWGSNPLTDHLWSTEATAAVHDGAGSDRFDKLRVVSELPLVQQHLRVCWERPGAGNCSRCEKCVRTMSMLVALGRLDRMRTFDGSVDLARLADRPMRDIHELRYATVIIRELTAAGVGLDIAAVMRRRAAQFLRGEERALRRQTRPALVAGAGRALATLAQPRRLATKSAPSPESENDSSPAT